MIDHEICGMVHRMLQRIAVDDVSLGLDILEKVGPGGHFLNQPHTLASFQKEHYIPQLCDRDSHETWMEKGRMGMLEKAKQKVKRILDEHQPSPLDPSVDKELLAVIREVEKREGI